MCIALEAVDDIANHILLELRDVAQYPGECEISFPTRAHQNLFLIRLLDFVREAGDKNLIGVSGSCLDVLATACETRSFDSAGSIVPLQEAVSGLQSWLDSKTPRPLWLPSLEIDATLKIPNIDFLYIAGNQSKHNLSRLTGVSKSIKEILANHGHQVDIERIPLALEDFHEHLHEDYFVYYGTWLAELLNNVRWALQDYLTPAFHQAYTRNDKESGRYTYEYPNCVVHDVPKLWFWRLMNNVRRGPNLKRFIGARYFKKHLSR